MTKLASAFGEKYQQSAASIRTKSFELGGHTFKVRVPLSKEIDEINERIENCSPDLIQSRYEKIIKPFLDAKETESVEILEKDVMVDGRSCFDLAKSAIKIEQRIVEYFQLLVVENGDLSNLTYADIEEEFPFPIQVELTAKITEAIQPGYKDTRKN